MDILTEGKLSVIRRYFFESVLVVLVICVVTLFYMYVDLTNYIRTELRDQVISTQAVIHDNARAINDLKDVIQQSNRK